MLELTGRTSRIKPEFGVSPAPADVALAAAGIVALAGVVGGARRAVWAQVAEVLRAE